MVKNEWGKGKTKTKTNVQNTHKILGMLVKVSQHKKGFWKMYKKLVNKMYS